MKAGDPLSFRRDLKKWQACLVSISDFADLTTWGLGRWAKPGWNDLLPNVLVVDSAFMATHRGNPFIYEWRINALDLASLGSWAALKASSWVVFKAAMLTMRDLGVSFGANWLISKSPLGVTREDDEVISPFDKGGTVFYLSMARLSEQGYTSYAIEGNNIVFFK